MPSLFEIQRGMAAATLFGDRAALASLGIVAGTMSAAERIDIYRNNVLGNYRNALAATFPVVKRLVGAAFFDTAVDAFVRAHWDTLSQAGVSPVPFLVPSQLRYLDFSARMLRDEHADGADVRWFRLSLASWYGFALPHIDVAYDRQSHELREYSGLSNIRDGDGRNLSVTIRFPSSERRTDVAIEDVERAARRPLTGRCSLK